jgi:hypothetical protein
MKIGRNHPCPCGSGKKYKHCCLLLPDNPYADSVADNPATGISDDLADLMADRDFESLEDAQSFADQFMRARNEAPSDDFHGLNPATMHRVLHFPFESPDLFEFPEQLNLEAQAPILTLLEGLFDQIGDGVKPTATGNLPLKVCRAVRSVFTEKHTNYSELSWPFKELRINTEPDFMDLHVARIVAELAGLLRVYRGKFVLTGACKKLLKAGSVAGLYPLLLKTYSRKFNWGYWDGYGQIPFIQHGFLFSLYLLQLFGGEWHDDDFYASHYLNAFPMAVDEVEESFYAEPDVFFKDCYKLRSLLRFAGLLGLAEVKGVANLLERDSFQLRATPLLGAAVRFTSKAVRGGSVAH